MKKLIILIVVLLSAVWGGSAADAAIIVGRISHVEGDIFRYMDVDDSWVETHLQSPAGIGDVLATGHNSRAEIAFPNNMLLRLDENTEVEILELDDDLGLFQLNTGVARLYSRSVSGSLAIETIRGTLKVAPGSVIDVQADENRVVVSAVQGEATFQSLRNGVEGMEVISGSTRLEFREESIVAGTGPISWDWDRWCTNREGIWSKNRLVRSEYLPESMQQYAYEMEPNGSWSRVYYRGYYYWAWKPHYVASGWSPYTNGYWYDWQGSPVWVDHNPWGWATHHHGHWIDMHGSWMWTPYIHVSHVPGVTVVGLNITFGRTYRPYWHPGRVRWIARNDYIGWFPLAPWETYYGYRRWDSRTVLVQGGSSLNFSINLSNHRHAKHGVIIPRRHLHKKGAVIVNNYKTVRIRNINKTVIVRDYKPLLTAERKRARKGIVAKSAWGRNFDRRRPLVQPERRVVKAGKTARHQRAARRDDRVIQSQREVQKERSIQNTSWRGSRQTIAKGHANATEKKRENSRAEKIQKKAVRPAQRTGERQIEKQEKPLPKSSIAERISVQRKQAIRRDRNKAGAEEPRPAEVESRRRSKVVQEKATVIRKGDRGERTLARKEAQQPQRQVARHEDRAQKASFKNIGKHTEKQERKEYKTERQISRNQNSFREKNVSPKRNTDRQKPGRGWISASMNNRRMR
jgi:hypothetical protein